MKIPLVAARVFAHFCLTERHLVRPRHLLKRHTGSSFYAICRISRMPSTMLISGRAQMGSVSIISFIGPLKLETPAERTDKAVPVS